MALFGIAIAAPVNDTKPTEVNEDLQTAEHHHGGWGRGFGGGWGRGFSGGYGYHRISYYPIG